jgi:hypothetical protein
MERVTPSVKQKKDLLNYFFIRKRLIKLSFSLYLTSKNKKIPTKR